MPASIGVNLRVTGHCRQGGRKYMEDFFSVAYQQTEDERDLEYAFFGIYDGHGGAEAAAFAKERLMESIVKHKNFWSDNDEDVLRAIKLGYIDTHYSMWKEQDKWPKTASGLPSTAGTTASIAFIRRGKIYIGHVGDSGIVLGYQEPDSTEWKAKPLTRDHKPECALEMSRIEQCGGKVISKSGVPRVVWNRPRIGHKGPVRRSTPIDEIPFLAVARSLGDLWSYNSELDEFVVSPDPDCSVIPIDTSTFRCLIFGTDGLYNMLNPQMAVHIVQQAEKHNEEAALSDSPNKVWLNPSKCLVERALELWSTTKMRADNTSVVTLMLDPPGPPRAQVLRNRKKNYADSGLQIVTRYQNETGSEQKTLVDSNTQQTTTTTTTTTAAFSASSKSVESFASLRSKSDRVFVLKPRESLCYDPRVFPNSDRKAPSPPPSASCFGDVSKDAELKSLSFKSVQSSTLSSGNSTQKTSRFFEAKVTETSCGWKDEEETKCQEVKSFFNCRNSDFESFASTSYVNLQNCENSSSSLSSTSPDFETPEKKSFCESCSCSKKVTMAESAPPKQKYEENIQIHEISSSSSDVDSACDPTQEHSAAKSKTKSNNNKQDKMVPESSRRLRKRLPEQTAGPESVKRRKTSSSADKRALRARKTEAHVAAVLECLKKLVATRNPSERIRDLKSKETSTALSQRKPEQSEAKSKATSTASSQRKSEQSEVKSKESSTAPSQRKSEQNEATPPLKNKIKRELVQKIAKDKNKSGMVQNANHKESDGRNKRRDPDEENCSKTTATAGNRKSKRHKTKHETQDPGKSKEGGGGKSKKTGSEAKRRTFKVGYLRKLRRRIRCQRNK